MVGVGWAAAWDVWWEEVTMSKVDIQFCRFMIASTGVLTRAVAEGVASAGEFAGGIMERGSSKDCRVLECRILDMLLLGKGCPMTSEERRESTRIRVDSPLLLQCWTQTVAAIVAVY